MPVHLTCSGCGATVVRPPSQANYARVYCSIACQKNRVAVSCKACGTPFEVKASKAHLLSYCSAACRAQRPVSVEVRFWRYVDKNGPVPAHRPELGACWLWTGKPDAAGYGRLGAWSREAGQKMIKAHRLALELKLGRPILPDLKALHHCDVKLCVRDTHLYEGTTQDNSDDAVERDRMPRGERSYNARFTDEIIRDMHALYAAGWRQVDIAAKYDTWQSTVSHILLGKSWRHIRES
jgi:endogenous inhibitor of DNA gyrase (YacG/DUF329 family)